MPYLPAQEFFTVSLLCKKDLFKVIDLLMLGLSVSTPRQAPKLFAYTTESGIPIPALIMTSSISALCVLTSFIGSGELWGWLQNIVGVSNQVIFHFPSVEMSISCIHIRSLGYPLVCRVGDSVRLGLNKEDP